MATLRQPAGLDDVTWISIQAHHRRLQRAINERDDALVIGSAKDLVEAAARAVLDARGETVPSNADFQGVVNKAHGMLEYQVGEGLAPDATVRRMASASKRIASELRALRNEYGTGHGRAQLPPIPPELVAIAHDGAVPWCGWALARLEAFIAGRPSALVNDLRDGAIFRAGDLKRRLAAAGLSKLDPADQHLIGIAVGQRAAAGTFVVAADGVEPVIEDQDLQTWPVHYRASLVEGLFLNRAGYVHVKPSDITIAARILAAIPNPEGIIMGLVEKIPQADWSARPSPDEEIRRHEVRRRLGIDSGWLPEGAREPWMKLGLSLRNF